MTKVTEEKNEPVKKPSRHNVVGGLEASQPSDPNSLYPDGVDPSETDEEHNARGQWSPYSEKQRKAAAVLIKQFQGEGMTLPDATTKAFKMIGPAEHMDEVVKDFKKKGDSH